MPTVSDAGLAPPSAFAVDFDPARDGFAFRNHFVWTDDDAAVLAAALKPWAAGVLGVVGAAGGAVGGRKTAFGGGLLGLALAAAGGGDRLVKTLARQWPSFGLCGGMALAAAERWPAGSRMPTSSLQRDLMRPLLRRRQEATLRASIGQFARYWAEVRLRPGAFPEAPFADRLRRELGTLAERLAAGRPAVVGLVGDAPDPFALHQVVVYGMRREGPIAATLDVYDPNAPGVCHTITTAPGRRSGRTALSTSMPTGPRATGGVHISSLPGHLSHLFVVDVEA